MTTVWRECLLGDIITLQRGFDITKKDQSPGPVWVISSSGPASTHSEARAAGPGVIIGRKGSLGTVYFSAEPFWPHDTTLWVKDFKGNHPRFIYYLLKTLGLARYDVGASNPTLNRNHVHLLSVRVPDQASQTRIASALDALDIQIETTQRRIERLEETVRLIFRDWFLRFRFPGHDDADLLDSKLGPIPRDWELSAIGDVINTVGGGTPSRKEPDYWTDPSITWFTPSDLTKAPAMFAFDSADQINDLGLAKSSAKIFPARTVMMTSRATIGEVAIATTDASTNQGFISCVPNERLSEFHLYFWLDANVNYFLTLAGGATFKELRKSTFRDLPIAVPPPALESRFNEVVGPMGALIENLLRQNAVLSEALDLLLPRLVSGELDVSDLDLGLDTVA